MRSFGASPAVPFIMTTELLHLVPERGQQGACSVSHLSPLPAGDGGSPGRMGQRLAGYRWSPWDQLGDGAPGAERGQRVQHQHHRRITSTLVITRLSLTSTSHERAYAHFLPIHLFHLLLPPHVWAQMQSACPPYSTAPAG